MPFSGDLDLFLKSRGWRRKRNSLQHAGWSAICSVVLLSISFVPSLPLTVHAYGVTSWSCYSVLTFGLLLELEFCCEAMAYARSLARAHHKQNKITNLSSFPKVYLLFVCEEVNYNCFNLRSHKGNWIFFCNREQLRHESFSVRLVSI